MGEQHKSLRLGDLVGGKYQLLKKIGEGGHGRVYRAVNTLLGREVAIKVLKPEVVSDETARRRFFREAKTANRVRHPNVVDVLDVGDSEDGPWMVQELLVGEPLSAVLDREGALSPSRAAELLLPAISALALAHARGIAHRDFKPENVFLARGEDGAVTPKILDFGLSKPTVRFASARESDQITASGVIVGTPAYLSPERVRFESDGDVAGDVWSIGVVLYECVTGALPFATTNVHELFACISRGHVVPIEDQPVEVDEEFAKIIARCLRRDPRERFASAAELEESLRRYAPHGAHDELPTKPARAASEDRPLRTTEEAIADELARGDAQAGVESIPAAAKGPSSTALRPMELDLPEPTTESARARHGWKLAAATVALFGAAALWSAAAPSPQRERAAALITDAAPARDALSDASLASTSLDASSALDAPAALAPLDVSPTQSPRSLRLEPRARETEPDASAAQDHSDRAQLREHR